jgi:hypothetical protein
MKFCPKCDRAMVRGTPLGKLEFRCPVCSEVVEGSEWDARVGGGVLGSGEVKDIYDSIIGVSAFDRTNQLVAKDCTECGRDYMTQLRVGEDEIIVHTCKCGARSDKKQKPESTETKR